jgi:hypothetical protein
MLPAFLATLVVGTRSNLYAKGVTEDGEADVWEAWDVVAEAEDGRRWVHVRTFLGHELGVHGAAEAAARLSVRVEEARGAGKWAGPVGNAHWSEIRPAYGSPAYSVNWRAYAAQDDLAEGNYDTPQREAELRERASDA